MIALISLWGKVKILVTVVSACSAALVVLTLCDSIDCSPSGFFVHGILQTRILAWVAMASSRGSPWPDNRTYNSCISCVAGRFFIHWASFLYQPTPNELASYYFSDFILKFILLQPTLVSCFFACSIQSRILPTSNVCIGCFRCLEVFPPSFCKTHSLTSFKSLHKGHLLKETHSWPPTHSHLLVAT